MGGDRKSIGVGAFRTKPAGSLDPGVNCLFSAVGITGGFPLSWAVPRKGNGHRILN